MKSTLQKLLFTAIFVLYACATWSITDFYSECVKNYDYGNVNVEIVEVSPVGKLCKQKCEDQCVIFSRFNRNGVQLNEDIMQDCQAACQRGDVDANSMYFASYYREEVVKNGVETVVYSGPENISEACTDQNEREYTTVTTSMSGLKDGDKIVIRLANAPQKIYMCGKKIIQYKPILASLDSTVWESTNKQNIYQDKDEHICLTYLDQATFDNLTFEGLWKEFFDPKYSDEKFDHCRWHARGYKYAATGIIPQRGDELAISWKGSYAYTNANIGVIATPRDNMMTRDEIVFCLDPVNNPVINQSKKNLCAELFRSISGVQFYNRGILSENQKGEPYYIPIFGEDARKPAFSISAAKAKNCASPANTPDVKMQGLSARVIDENFKLDSSGFDPKCATRPDYACSNSNKCFKITTMGDGHYMFGGILKPSDHDMQSGNNLDFSARAELYIRHFDSTDTNLNNQINYYSDNVGGFEMSMAWGGCPKEEGEGLQYAVWDQNIPVPEDEWKDVPLATLYSKEPFTLSSSYTGTEGGTLYFRIKSEDPPISGPYQELYENYGNRFGAYHIALKRHGDYGALDKNNPFVKLVKLVREIVLGYELPNGGYVDGATQIIYKGVVSDYKFVQMIQALLVIYVALQAVLFIMGVININQKEFVVRIFKIAVIVAIISPGSWEFLYFNFLKAFIDGSIELIALIVSSAYPNIDGIDIQQDPTLIFAIFGAVIAMVFKNAIWIKIAALMLNGIVGFAIAIVIMVSILIYALCVVRAVVMYIFSLIGISLLILLAPIFIPLMLFKMTENFFNSWWKLILSFALQPVMVFTTITIFNVLMITLLYSSLNFTVCKSCIWPVSIPWANYDACWIPGYRVVHNLHLPGEFSGTFLPLNILGAGIAFLLLAHAMWIFTGFITQITSRIVTQMFIRSATVSGQEEALRTAAVDTVELGADIPITHYKNYVADKQEKAADDARLARKRKAKDDKKKKKDDKKDDKKE